MKYKQVKINLTPEHHQELEKEALENNQTIAQFIRDKLSIDLKTKPRIRKMRSDKKVVVKADPQLLYHLSKIGSNINQISKHLNSNNPVDRVVLNTLIEIQQEIKNYDN